MKNYQFLICFSIAIMLPFDGMLVSQLKNDKKKVYLIYKYVRLLSFQISQLEGKIFPLLSCDLNKLAVKMNSLISRDPIHKTFLF